MRIYSVIGFCVLIFGACVTAFAQQEIPNDLEITLTRTLCFGWCPAYSLTITADGLVEFTPSAGFAYVGKGEMPQIPIQGRVQPDKLKALIVEFKKIKFSSLRKTYVSAGDGKTGSWCPHYWTDGPSAQIYLRQDGKEKTVSHYLGCKGAKILEDLEALEQKIDDVTNSKQWVSQFGWGGANVVDLKITKNPK